MNKEEFLFNLTKEVLLPVISVLEKKVEIGNIPRLIKKLKLNSITIFPFSKKVNEEIIKNFEDENVIKEINKLGLDKYDLILIISYLYCQLKMFIEKYNYNKFAKDYNKLFYKICDILQKDNVVNIETKEEFIDFTSEQDENIKSMHYTDEEKISAKDFMEKENFDEDLIADIKDLLDEYGDLSLKYTTLSKELIDMNIKFLTKFSALLFLSVEFKDLAKIIEEFVTLLTQLDIDSLKEDQKQFLKMFIDAFMDDIKKWYEEIILYKSANDIHYLDASLLSSIKQIEDFIKNTKG